MVDLLKSEGYEVFVVFISNIPKKVVKKRALERYQKSGRFVPMLVIDDFYENGEKTFDQVKKIVDGYIVVDGSTFDYNLIEKGGKSLPNKRLYSKLGYKLTFALGGGVGSDYESHLLSDQENILLNKILKNPIFKDSNEIETFESGGGFVHTMVMLSNNHIVTFNFENDVIQYSYHTYNSIEEYLSEETASEDGMGWDNESYTPNAGMRETEISRPTNNFFDKMNKTKAPNTFANGGRENSDDKARYRIRKSNGNIKYAGTDYPSWFTLEKARELVNYSNGEMIYEYDNFGDELWEVFAVGGSLEKETNEMFESQIKEAKHHTSELDSVVDSNTEIEPWVLAKMTRAKTDLSDITHYLDGETEKMANGGNIQWSDARIGDMANVIAENRSGVILKDYGRKFHIRFADGSEKTYDASELNFYRFDDEEYSKGGLIFKDKKYDITYSVEQRLDGRWTVYAESSNFEKNDH